MLPEETFCTDLERAADGDAAARARVYERSYGELAGLAKAALNRGWRGKVSMSTTDVLHDAFARLVGRANVEQRGRAYFFGCFAKACRDVLVDHWKRRARRDEITLITQDLGGAGTNFDPVQLDDLIGRLSRRDPRGATVATMRIFACMTHQEIADALAVSLRTVEADWAYARLWLRQHYT